MPNDTAPEKTGSSENGDWAGRHDLPCDLAAAQLRPPGFWAAQIERRANAGLAAWPSVLASKIHPEPKALPSLLARLVERFADPLDQIAAGGVGLAL